MLVKIITERLFLHAFVRVELINLWHDFFFRLSSVLTSVLWESTLTKHWNVHCSVTCKCFLVAFHTRKIAYLYFRKAVIHPESVNLCMIRKTGLQLIGCIQCCRFVSSCAARHKFEPHRSPHGMTRLKNHATLCKPFLITHDTYCIDQFSRRWKNRYTPGLFTDWEMWT